MFYSGGLVQIAVRNRKTFDKVENGFYNVLQWSKLQSKFALREASLRNFRACSRRPALVIEFAGVPKAGKGCQHIKSRLCVPAQVWLQM